MKMEKEFDNHEREESLDILERELEKMFNDLARKLVKSHLKRRYNKEMQDVQNYEMMVDIAKEAFYFGQRSVHTFKNT